MQMAKNKLLSDLQVRKTLDQYGSTFFCLDLMTLEQNAQSLNSSFSKYFKNFQPAYSVKTNYTPKVVSSLHNLGFKPEVVSEAEYEHALSLGIDPKDVIFNGPARSAASLEKSLLQGATVNLDSRRDLEILKYIADRYPSNYFRFGLRLSLGIKKHHSRFGLDLSVKSERDAVQEVMNYSNLRLSGIHLHCPDRDLASFSQRASYIGTLYNSFFSEADIEYINIGGGMYSMLPSSLMDSLSVRDCPSFEDYASTLHQTLSEHISDLERITLVVEPGTAIIANAFNYYTTVLEVKYRQGKAFANVSGSILDYAAYSRNKNLPFYWIHSNESSKIASFDVTGYTCIESDVLLSGVEAPISPGDILCIENVGSYSIVMKPPFISEYPAIVSVDHDGRVCLLRPRQSPTMMVEGFVE